MPTAGAVLTAQPTPEVARRAWPRWLALGAAMIAVAAASIAWDDGGARLLLGATGLFLAVRGAVLLRTAPGLGGDLAGRARTLGRPALAVGGTALVVALVTGLADRVLLVGLPLLLVGGALALLTRSGATRRGGQALLAVGVLVTGLLVAVGVARDWSRAADVATVVAAVAVALLAVPVLVSALNLRAVASRPAPAPAGAGCGGCACGAGGCGS